MLKPTNYCKIALWEWDRGLAPFKTKTQWNLSSGKGASVFTAIAAADGNMLAFAATLIQQMLTEADANMLASAAG